MNVINKEYQQLEEQIQVLSEKWSLTIGNVTLTSPETISAIQHYPVIPQLGQSVDIEKYESFIVDLLALLKESQPALLADFEKLEQVITQNILEQWYKEAIAVNNFYFEKFAKDHQIAEWVPFFVAEHAVRPFLKKISKEMEEILEKAEHTGSCPACGEAPRIAIINKKGKKEITCPRCEYAWEVKKIKCAHCGNEEPRKIEIMKVEKEDSAEVHVCSECMGYTKVIDVRKKIKQEPIALLDITSIHLDFIAQENGYGIPEKKNVN
jgi:FdhE protein